MSEMSFSKTEKTKRQSFQASHGNANLPSNTTAPSKHNNNTRRVRSVSWSGTEPPQILSITITHGNVLGQLCMFPDTGADILLIGPQHLFQLGLSQNHLQLPLAGKQAIIQRWLEP
ncbi:hypothetical protein Pcinc_010407 [Petrolisthes cinctipes]|uniref:Peptidase A2 domain-containing protein n=1 Tax=Petrolisthes cinctipes TaxID=88211 RepID=A0AAE1KTE5_PETCI|nr:hypothetical protein Pcinc_010608 [Petrolisthes cinctipes]KAK3885375.1 hypothetical protein Pcinc_010407 [Petrolisthes cinctipes]